MAQQTLSPIPKLHPLPPLPAERPSRPKGRKKAKKGRALKRVGLCLAVFFCSVLTLFFGAVTIVSLGPSTAARDLLVVSAMETSAAKFLARMYFSDAEIEKIIADNTVRATEQITDTGLVEIPGAGQPEFDKTKLEVVDVSGPTFKGKMMVINDPSRVYIATPPAFGPEEEGMRVEDMVRRDGAVAGTNAGGFEDANGVGKGGQPIGLVISQGRHLSGSLAASSDVVGFDRDNKLVVGRMTGQQALDRGLRDAVSFGPVLIVNGEATEITGTGGGLNPRTAIGQRPDGAVLLLVIDGRQPHSIGASYRDIIWVMEQFGAVNAANLDGGSSSLMIYEDRLITVCASLYGSRKLPTAVLVRGVE